MCRIYTSIGQLRLVAIRMKSGAPIGSSPLTYLKRPTYMCIMSNQLNNVGYSVLEFVCC